MNDFWYFSYLPWRHYGEYHDSCAFFDLNVNEAQRIRVLHQQHYAYTLFLRSDQSMHMSMRRGNKLLNKVVIFVFFAHKKYSRSFVKLWLNHWCHMDHFSNVLTMFLCFDCGSILAVYGRVRDLSSFIRNILICVLKMNEGLTGLERH